MANGMAHVAIVDGEQADRKRYARTLANRGYHVSAFGGVRECQDLLFELPPDIVILNTHLPDGSGLELASMLRGVHTPESLPILFVSAANDESDYLRGFAAGANDFLEKPVSDAELATKCDRLVNARALRAAVAPPPLIARGKVFAGRYRIDRRMGEGGYGSVFAAFDLENDGKPVALKILHASTAGQPECRWRFLREIYALGAIRHPGVVRVLDNGEADGALYLTMEHVAGHTLTSHVHRHGPVSEQRLVRFLIAVTEALRALERADLLHRDLKPSNILLRDGKLEQPVLVDFGLARRPCDRSVTGPDVILGTLGYLAPENMIDGNLDARSDLFSLAMVACFASTGAEPFASIASDREILQAVQTRRVEFPRQLSQPVRRLLEEMASISRDRRPAGPAEVLERLLRLRTPQATERMARRS